MPQMKQKLILKLWVKSFFLVFLFNQPIDNLEAKPWMNPDDVLVKHDVQILSDSGLLDIPINTWPISWGDVAYNLRVENISELSTETLLSLQRIRQRLIEEEMGGISANAEIKISKNPDRIMILLDPVKTKKYVSSETSYMSENVAINLRFEKTEDGQVLDETYVSLARGNYSMTIGSKKNWWGPGWMGSSVLSSNSRPIRGLSVERNFSDPFQNRFLSILGGWDLAFILGDIKNNDLTPDRRFSALRLGIRPKENLELGFSKSAVICDKDDGCGFSSIVDGLTGSGNVYDLNTIDYRVSGFLFDIPYATYGQISGTSLDKSLGIFGIETWGSLAESEKIESYRFFSEFSSTTCGIFDGRSKYGCAYQNEKYPSAYQNDGVNIGHSLDGDSLALSMGAILVVDDTQLYKSTVSIGKINRGSDLGYTFTKNATDFLNFNLGYQFDLYWYDIPLGSFDVGLGFDIYKDKVSGSSEKDPRLYVLWNNSIDLYEQKARDFSEYIDLIEVQEEKIENIDSSDQAIIQFVSFNESELASIISLIDQTAVDRGDTAFANYTPEFKSTNEIIDQLSKSSNDTSLSDYLASVDETISKRN